jgi:NAD+ kinase
MYTPQPALTRLSFKASDRPEAEEARDRLIARYGDVGEDAAQVIVALGGDGFMLETLHGALARQTPIYGMNRGSVGFLMNEYSEDDLLERINAAERTVIHPLAMTAIDAKRQNHRAWRSTRSRFCARPARPPSCASRSTARCGWESWSATAR